MVEDTARGDTRGIRSKSGDGGPLRVHVRPRMPEQHRHTPSLRGGDAEERQRRGGKKKKKKKKEGEREREREREGKRRREEEKGGEREGRREGVGGSLMSHLH